MTSGGRITWHTSYRERGKQTLLPFYPFLPQYFNLMRTRAVKELILKVYFKGLCWRRLESPFFLCLTNNMFVDAQADDVWVSLWQSEFKSIWKSQSKGKWLVKLEMVQRWSEKLLLVSDLCWKIGQCGGYLPRLRQLPISWELINCRPPNAFHSSFSPAGGICETH